MKLRVSALCALALLFAGENMWAGPISPVDAQACRLESQNSSNIYQIILPRGGVNPITTPLCSENGEFLRIDGAADVVGTAALLKPYGFFPLLVNEFGGMAFWQVWVAKHSTINVGVDGQSGSYYEVILSVAATRTKDKPSMGLMDVLGQLSSTPTPSDFGFYVAKIWVSTDIAAAAGNEIWGFNKGVAGITMRTDDGSIFSRMTEGGRTTLKIKISTPNKNAMPLAVNYYTYTRFTQANATATGAQMFSDNFGAEDQIVFGQSGYGAKMNELQFHPVSKTYAPVANLKFEGPQPFN